MRKFLLGLFVGLALTFVVLIVIGFAIGRLFAAKQPVIASNSVLVLDLDGDIPEAAPVDVPIPFFSQRGVPAVHTIWAALHEAKEDSRIKALVLVPRSLGVGWARVQELHEELLEFKKSGKPVYAYLESPGSREYYLATAADKIFTPPDELVNVRGVRAESFYLKGVLDKFGVGVQVDHMGKYKDAGDMFTRSDMSPESREVTNAIVDQIFGDLCTTIAVARHKTADEVKALMDQGPFIAREAKAAGLIDQIAYEDEVYSDLKAKTGSSDLKKLDMRTYAPSVAPHGDKIALVVAQGEIFRGRDNNGALGSSQTLTSGGMQKLLRQVRGDNSIKGVVLRVDSPGGDAQASDEILHEMRLLSKAKPLVISFADVAASGAYMFAMTGDPILAYPDTLTGSIGVLYVRPNIHELLNKLGVTEEIVTRGTNAGIDSLSQPLSPAAEQKLHDMIQSTYISFVGKVAEARRKSYEQAESLAQGRVWMGEEARTNGLVDQLGGLDAAVALVRKRANLSPNGATNLAVYPQKRSLIEVLTQTSPDSFADAKAEAKIRELLPVLPSRSVLKGGMLQILPYTIQVQ